MSMYRSKGWHLGLCNALVQCFAGAASCPPVAGNAAGGLMADRCEPRCSEEGVKAHAPHRSAHRQHAMQNNDASSTCLAPETSPKLWQGDRH